MSKQRNKQYIFSLLLLASLVLGLVAPAAAAPAAQPASRTQTAPANQAPVTTEQALQKISPKLRAQAQNSGPAQPQDRQPSAPEQAIRIMVIAAPGTDLSAYMSNIKAQRAVIEGEQNFFGEVPASRLLKIASLPSVATIVPVSLEKDGPSPITPEEAATKAGPQDWAVLRANADKIRAGSKPWDQSKAFGDGRTQKSPNDWFEVSPDGPHKAQAAWARGFDGTGVTVAVNDDGIDWGHPDLMGMQKIYTTGTNTPTPWCPNGCSAYNGWPMVFSPFSTYLYAQDYGYIAGGYTSAHYADTSATPALTPAAPGVSTFTYTPLIAFYQLGMQHTYVVDNSMTKSGVIHVGTHPDENLRDYVWGEKVAVIVTDPHVAGVYDTVYVDLNDDYDFRDEKPLSKADVTNALTLDATKNNMIAYRDLNDDGKADLSGGALYFIADGLNPIPFASFLWGATAYFTPDNGSLVAFDGPWASGYSHGTQCASNVVGQGKVNGMLPTFADLSGSGQPAGAVYGAAKNARLIDVSNIYYNFDSSKLDAYTFAVYGYDGQRSTLSNGTVNPADGDGYQVTSNSYGTSNADNDGWDYDGRYISRRIRLYANYLSMLVSTGNGAPGYGTTTPPKGDVAMAVGASTLFGTTGWDSITRTTQIESNDIIGWSNRGPGASGKPGVDVVADGAFAAGDEALNYYSISTWGAPDGNLSWAAWGGTSRSSPAAMGNLAIIYQAFRAKNGRWPSYLEARELFKSTSTDLNYDVFTQGAGSVNSDRGSAVAAGWYGLSVSPDEWTPGGYNGVNYPGFAHVVKPGETASTVVTVKNRGIEPITADLFAGDLNLIESKTINYTVTPAMFAARGVANGNRIPQFVIPITATNAEIAANPWWNNISVPQNANLMVATMLYPLSQFDADGNYTADNAPRLYVDNWTDINGNHKVWDDKNGNGQVDYTLSSAVTVDLFREPNWAATELDRWEYMRFGYGYNTGNKSLVRVHDPLTQMHDGLFLGIAFGGAATVPQTNFQFRIDFYKYDPVSWLTLDAGEVTVPAGGQATFNAQVNATGMSAGMYEAAIKVMDPGGTVSGEVAGPNGPVTIAPTAFAAHTSVVPVAMTVAPDFTAGMTFGGATQAAAEQSHPYDNATVGGYFDWAWRAESGDWRFFMFDNKTAPAPGTSLLTKTTWADKAPHTDIDTLIMGPTSDCFSGGAAGCTILADPAYYGPYSLATKGNSPNANTTAGVWRFNTSSGGAEDWVSAPFQQGLHMVAAHNVLFEGDKFDVPFTVTVGTITAAPNSIDLSTYQDSGSVPIVVNSSLLLPNLVADAYGLGGPQHYSWQIPENGADGWAFKLPLTVSHASKLDIATSSPNISDIDIYLYKQVGTSWQQVASSAGGTANEHVLLVKPADGIYQLRIDNYSGPAGQVDAVVQLVQGSDLTITGLQSSPIPANTPVTLMMNFDKTMNPGDTYEGSLLLGPSAAPAALEIPVRITRLAATATLEKSVDHDVSFPGDLLDYTLKLFNTGSEDTDFTFVDPIPTGTEFVTVTNSAQGTAVTFDEANNRLVYSGKLGITEGPTPSLTTHLITRLKGDVAAGSFIENTATLTATHGIVNEPAVTASATTQVGAPNVTVSLESTKGCVLPGDVIDYKIHVKNDGNGLASVTVSDTIPAHTAIESIDTAVPYQHFLYDASTNRVEWSGSVAPGEEWIFSFQVAVDNSTSLWRQTIKDTAWVDADEQTMSVDALTCISAPWHTYLPIMRQPSAWIGSPH